MSSLIFLFLLIFFNNFFVEAHELPSIGHTNTSSTITYDIGSQCLLTEPQRNCPYNPHSPIVRCEYLYVCRLSSILYYRRIDIPL